MTDFSYMQDTVDEIVRSLREEPFKWNFDTFTFNKKGADVHFWIPLGSAVTEVRDCGTNSVVFSCEQGRAIYAAYKFARERVANKVQEKIIASINPCDVPPKVEAIANEKSWWQFWK